MSRRILWTPDRLRVALPGKDAGAPGSVYDLAFDSELDGGLDIHAEGTLTGTIASNPTAFFTALPYIPVYFINRIVDSGSSVTHTAVDVLAESSEWYTPWGVEIRADRIRITKSAVTSPAGFHSTTFSWSYVILRSPLYPLGTF